MGRIDDVLNVSGHRLGTMGDRIFHTFFFLLEMALFLTPALLLMKRERRYDPGIQFLAGMMMICAGTLYRFDVYMIQFDPGPGWSYLPSIAEMSITSASWPWKSWPTSSSSRNSPSSPASTPPRPSLRSARPVSRRPGGNR